VAFSILRLYFGELRLAGEISVSQQAGLVLQTSFYPQLFEDFE
jgi:hypothetical protein